MWSHQACQNVNALRRAGRGRGSYRIFANVTQARVGALGFEGSEQDRVCTAIEEKGSPAGELVNSLSVGEGRESARTLKMSHQEEQRDFPPLAPSSTFRRRLQ